MSEHEQDQDFQHTIELLGSQLKAAREKNQRTIDEVAASLMLDKTVVQGLEVGDYTSLPELPYVRGYLSAYLRLLKLPESALSAFDQVNQQPELPLNLKTSVSGPSCSRDGWARCVSVGLVVFLIVVTGLWVVEQSFHVLQYSSNIVESSTVGEDDFKEENEEPSNIDVVDQEVLSQVQAEVPAVATEIVTVPVIEITTESNIQVSEVSIPDQGEQVIAEPQTEVAPSNGLQLAFSGESWVRVEDATGERLRAGTFQDGEAFVVAGKPPYSIILGSAGHVKIHFQGVLLDTPRKVGRVARFSVAESGTVVVQHDSASN